MNKYRNVKLFRGGKKHMHTAKARLVKATIVEGQFAQDVKKELLIKPSPVAILRNKQASDLVKKLRK